ncbi:MAG TPA: Clp protease N-terminal domain-containing protein [Gemmatimonadaceae bacterium]
MASTQGYPLNYHARRVLKLARAEAARLGDAVVEPRHIVLGIVREGESAALPYLERSFSDLDVLCRKMEQAGTRSRDSLGADPESLRLSAGGKRVVARAISEAKRLNQDAVGGVHLLLGALPARPRGLGRLLSQFRQSSNSNAAAMALMAGGLRFEWLRADLARITAELPLDDW